MKIYKKFVSPLVVYFFGHACRFQPSCSEYGHEAIAKYGVVRGGMMALVRVVKCNPFSEISYDPVK